MLLETHLLIYILLKCSIDIKTISPYKQPKKVQHEITKKMACTYHSISKTMLSYYSSKNPRLNARTD
jgi:hypothetical protein